MHIGVIGVNHKLANVTLREMIARACQRRFFLENPIENGTFVLLSTCNRSEIYFHADDLVEAHQTIITILKQEIAEDFEQRLYTFFGLDCFFHLAKVTAGLDSAIIAETEIQGQVKAAYEAAIALKKLPRELHFLFQKCLKLGKEVRSHYQLTKALPDLEHALFFYAQEFFNEPLPPVLFVGASQINLKIANFFKRKGLAEITFCNRSEVSKDFLGMECPILGWQELARSWQDFSWVICATKSPHYLLTQPKASLQKRQLLVDLAVPRNIDPRIGSETTSLLNIDHLEQLLANRRSFLASQVTQAENRLVVMVERLIAQFQTNRQSSHSLVYHFF